MADNSLDIIKQYLISIGFTIDSNSENNTRRALEETDRRINRGAENTQNTVNRTSNIIQGLYDIINGMPELRNLIPEDVRNSVNDIVNNINNISNTNVNDIINRIIPPNSGRQANGVINGIGSNLNSMLSNSTSSIAGFSAASVASIAVVIAAFKLLYEAIKKVITTLNDLANQDIEYEKMSRQLWTTKENAKEVTKALKTLGVSAKDLWLSPTLLKQFNQLRKDSAALKLPPEYTKNLKLVQDIGLEWKRTKQMGSMAIEWISHYILKYLREPLLELKKLLHSGNDFLIKAIPRIGKVIGETIGRFLGLIIKIINSAIKLGKVIGELSKKFILTTSKGNDNTEKIIKSFKLLKAVIETLFLPFTFLFYIIQDIYGYLTGQSSVLGYIIDKLTKKLNGSNSKNSFLDTIKTVMDTTKTCLKEIDDFIQAILDKLSQIPGVGNLFKDKSGQSVGEGGNKEEIYSKIKGIKDISTNGFKMFIPFVGPMMYAKGLYDSYESVSGSTTSIDNSSSNRSVTNNNTFNVYGGDANANAAAISNRFKNSNVGNFQGAFQ